MKSFTKIIVFTFFFFISIKAQNLFAQGQNNIEFSQESSNSLNNVRATKEYTSNQSTLDVKKITKKVGAYKSISNVKQRKRLRFRSKRKDSSKCYRATVCAKTKRRK